MKTEVLFRKEKSGDVVAIFPYMISDYNGNITCYSHLGQHSGCDPLYVRETKPTTDFKDLLCELECIGYDVKIVRRINWDRYNKTRRKELCLG